MSSNLDSAVNPSSPVATPNLESHVRDHLVRPNVPLLKVAQAVSPAKAQHAPLAGSALPPYVNFNFDGGISAAGSKFDGELFWGQPSGPASPSAYGQSGAPASSPLPVPHSLAFEISAKLPLRDL